MKYLLKQKINNIFLFVSYKLVGIIIVEVPQVPIYISSHLIGILIL